MMSLLFGGAAAPGVPRPSAAGTGESAVRALQRRADRRTHATVPSQGLPGSGGRLSWARMAFMRPRGTVLSMLVTTGMPLPVSQALTPAAEPCAPSGLKTTLGIGPE